MKTTKFLFVIFLSVIVVDQAHAYIEPGFGSLLIQTLLGGFIGASVIFRSYWYKLLNFFFLKKKNK